MIELAVTAVVALVVATTWMVVLGLMGRRYRRPMILFGSAALTLGTLVTYALLQPRDPAQKRGNAARAQIALLVTALDTYRADVGVHPTNEEGLQALRVRLPGAGNWNGPYFRKEISVDPWGHPFVHRYRGPSERPDVISYGADGRPGGDGDAADISE